MLASACSTATNGATTTGPVQASPPEPAMAAESLCPILWEWTKAIGAAFNDAAAAMADLPEPEDRRTRWSAALNEMETLESQLLRDIAPLAADPIAAALVEAIGAGVETSRTTIDEIRTLLSESPEVDEQRHQVRTSQIVVRIEKVIDVVKPELADHDVDGTLIAAFRAVPSCQHAVKDANDGLPRAND